MNRDQPTTFDAELWTQATRRPDGSEFDNTSPEGIEEMAVAEADGEVLDEYDVLGAVRFTVIESDASALALNTGAIEPGDAPRACWIVHFDQSADAGPTPAMGHYIVLRTEGINITFTVILSHADLHDPDAPDLGPDAVRNPDLEVLQPGQALLVQVLPS